MKKKIFAVITAVFMVMALIPTIAFAADTVTWNITATNGGEGDLYVWYGGVGGDAAAQFGSDGKVTIEVPVSTWGCVIVNMPAGTPFAGGSDWDNKNYQSSDVKLDAGVAAGATVDTTVDLTEFVPVASEPEESPAESDESPATSEEESSETPAESSEISVESSDPTPASSDPTTPPTTSNPPSGVQGITIAVVAATVAGVVVSAKKSKK